MVELLGYLAMGLVAFSFTLKDFRTFRMVNSGGAVLFVLYAALTHAWPVVGVNVFILVVNLYQLGWLPKMGHKKSALDSSRDSSSS